MLILEPGKRKNDHHKERQQHERVPVGDDWMLVGVACRQVSNQPDDCADHCEEQARPPAHHPGCPANRDQEKGRQMEIIARCILHIPDHRRQRQGQKYCPQLGWQQCAPAIHAARTDGPPAFLPG